ncbi:hypothetical protein [Bradyrhizobium sp. 138]|nr:hypothetical protein [Bradyrhizobium sp. 138]
MTKKTRRKIDAALEAKIALRGSPEPDLCLEEATAGTGGPGL